MARCFWDFPFVAIGSKEGYFKQILFVLTVHWMWPWNLHGDSALLVQITRKISPVLLCGSVVLCTLCIFFYLNSVHLTRVMSLCVISTKCDCATTEVMQPIQHLKTHYLPGHRLCSVCVDTGFEYQLPRCYYFSFSLIALLRNTSCT